MWLTKGLKVISFRPMEAVGFILALAVLLAGAWLLSPFFQPDESTGAKISGSLQVIPTILGAYQVIVGTIWLAGIFNKSKNWSLVVRRTCSFMVFLLYTFYGISGVILNGIHRITWLSTFTIAFIAAIKYLWLGVVGDKDDGN
jgi:hypothetical protein